VCWRRFINWKCTYLIEVLFRWSPRCGVEVSSLHRSMSLLWGVEWKSNRWSKEAFLLLFDCLKPVKESNTSYLCIWILVYRFHEEYLIATCIDGGLNIATTFNWMDAAVCMKFLSLETELMLIDMKNWFCTDDYFNSAGLATWNRNNLFKWMNCQAVMYWSDVLVVSQFCMS
jgi:hypothetical protein